MPYKHLFFTRKRHTVVYTPTYFIPERTRFNVLVFNKHFELKFCVKIPSLENMKTTPAKKEITIRYYYYDGTEHSKIKDIVKIKIVSNAPAY